jgi:hypothetical protein
VAGADAGAGQDEQTVLGQKRPQLVDERQDRLMAAIHDGAAADFDDLHPWQQSDRAFAGDRTGEIAVEQGLARERREDVLDLVGTVENATKLKKLEPFPIPKERKRL